MDTLNELIGILLRPVVAWCLLAMVVGQILKTQLWTRERAYRRGRWQWWWWWGRKTMALHPALAGVVIGIVWPGTIEDGYRGGTLLGAVYFAAGGMGSVWAFEALRGLAKRKGVDIPDLPGLDDRVSRLPAPPPLPRVVVPDDDDDDARDGRP